MTASVPSRYSAVHPPRGFREGPFPFHYHLNIVIDSLGDLGWGSGHLAKGEDQDLTQPSYQGAGTVEEIERAQTAAKSVKLSDDDTTATITNWEIRVPLVMPGELVKVRIVKNFDSYSEADLIAVISKSPKRIEPKCPLAGSCGGCQFQHMDIQDQREWKTESIRRGLEAQSLPTANLLPTLGTKEIFGYRNKITPHYQAPLQVGENEYELQAIGFQQVTCRDIIDVEECPIATPAINLALKETRAELHQQAKEGLLNNKKRRKRNRRSKTVDLGATLLFREADPDPQTHEPVVVTDFHQYMTTTVQGIKFTYRAGNFFQNNNYVVPLMVDAVLKAALQKTPQNKTPQYLLDCYCGSGLFALSASKAFKLCVGIEVNDLAVQEATENAVQNKIENCQFVAASAEAIFTSPPSLTLKGFEDQRIQDFPRDSTVVVLDPPRKGCSGSFLEQLYEYSPQRIVYMSCGPLTQARDAKGIVEVGGYEILSIQPFDLFPQTKHVECLMVFEKKNYSS